MLEINLNQTDLDIVRFSINCLQLLPKLCLDSVIKLELSGITKRIIYKVNNNEPELHAAILLENIERVNKWYNNKEKINFLQITKEITTLLSKLIKEYLSENKINIIISLQSQIISLFKNLYTILESDNQLKIKPSSFIKKLKNNSKIFSLEKV